MAITTRHRTSHHRHHQHPPFHLTFTSSSFLPPPAFRLIPPPSSRYGCRANRARELCLTNPPAYALGNSIVLSPASCWPRVAGHVSGGRRAETYNIAAGATTGCAAKKQSAAAAVEVSREQVIRRRSWGEARVAVVWPGSTVGGEAGTRGRADRHLKAAGVIGG